MVHEQLSTASTPAARSRAQRFLDEEVIASPGFGDCPFDAGSVWEGTDSRARDRYHHGFLFFGDWVKTILADDTTQVRAARAAVGIVETWTKLHGDQAHASDMAYHDETTAQRLLSLIAIRPAIAAVLPREDAEVLAPLMSSTAALLARQEFHAGSNNHGMFQDLALLYWSIVADNPHSNHAEYYSLAMSRLRRYFEASFTADGVHVENAPTYHLMVSRQAKNVMDLAVAAEHTDSAFYSNLIRRAERYATHALMPNGTYPPISDTQQNEIAKSGARGVFPGPEFLYATTQGLRGKPPQEKTLVLPDSGYAIYRSAWGDPDATYAFFSAAYNADYHKHSDDLSFFLHSGGIDLLSESGPYSYDYKDPFSKYAYSQFAHNSLVVDGTSLPRTDGRADRVSLRAVEERADGFTVVGTNGRYDDVVHERTVEVREANGKPLFDLTDEIISTSQHSYQLLWNLGTEVSVVLHGQGFELFRDGLKVMDLMVDADVPVTLALREGVEKPRPLGWRFPKFGQAVPAKVVTVSFNGQNTRVRTKIRLSDFSYTERLSPADPAWSRHSGEVPVNYLFRPGASARGREHLAVVFSAIHQPGDFTYNYKATVDEVDISALYILDDFGDQGAYYHSDHRSETIYRSVQALILGIANKHGIEASKLVAVGSSKGGTAALIHGMTLPFGRIIVGAPQTRIGTFVAGPHPNILQFMAGGTSEQDIEHLNGIVQRAALTAGSIPRTSILVGANDHHLRGHVEPLLDDMASKGLPRPAVTVLPDLSHADIGSVFRFFLAANLEQFVSGKGEEALPYIISPGKSPGSVRLKVYAPAGTRLAYRLYLDAEVVAKRGYADRQVVVFEDLAPGRYRIRVYLQAPDGTEPTAFTTRWVGLRKV
ncbi:heparinase II/III family protein [Arthrobacter crusticola]|nr:heparinase II/III-family protein [Arthrobacter crusticola]